MSDTLMIFKFNDNSDEHISVYSDVTLGGKLGGNGIKNVLIGISVKIVEATNRR
jgi:hypothetical protein